ncbi:Rhodanese-like domain-containing protein [Mycena amicta]|nr:Rhodanese-like domain-containing protein [Mycena amicta]
MSSGTEWHAIFPTPSSAPEWISSAELASIMMDSQKEVFRDYVVVDVRRTDFEDFAVVGCLNLPAHSFYQTLPTIIKILGGVPLVIFHCNSCKEGGRGWRTAGWYQDAVNKAGISSKGVILEGGIQGWAKEFSEDARLTQKI